MNTHYAFVLDTLRTILSTLSVPVENIEEHYDEKMKMMRFQIISSDSAILIGEHGARLQALNYLLKKIFEHKKDKEKITDDVSFMVDVNNYQSKRIDELRTKASMMAERARYFRTSMPMEPMSSYERMIVHAEFTESPDIRTESSGAGKDRHVVLYFDDQKSLKAK